MAKSQFSNKKREHFYKNCLQNLSLSCANEFNLFFYIIRLLKLFSINRILLKIISIESPSRRVDDVGESRWSLCKFWRKLHFSRIKIDDLKFLCSLNFNNFFNLFTLLNERGTTMKDYLDREDRNCRDFLYQGGDN